VDLGRLFKWLVIIALVILAWRVGLPWLKQQKLGGAGASSSSPAGDDSCAAAAERASETWGSGLAQFVNPPYDLNAWSSFRGRVDEQISGAESKCSCAQTSCGTVRGALRDLRGLVSDLDAAIRNGSSPGGDIVQRQEHIDTLISEARDQMLSVSSSQ
jgi:hypothetical protein